MTSEDLLNTLEDLIDDEFKGFKWYLQQPAILEGYQTIKASKLERAERRDTVDLMVKTFKLDGALKLSKKILEKINRNDLVQSLSDTSSDEDVPEVWDAMPANTSSQAFAVKAGTAEHTEVLNLFKATCGQNVIKIERIQNPVLWKSLQIKKHDMEQRNGHQNNDRRLFHGTCHDTVATINEHGFNRSYAGKNATCYGNGTYFAVNASYSASNTYSKPNQNGEKCMYLCRVLTGDYTTGQPNMIAPPAKGPVSVQKYDSVVDKMAGPNMFVIFHDSQAYPEYLITFK